MNILDLVLGVILLLGLVRGFFKGFFVELAGLVALIAGIYGAIYFSDGTLKFLKTFIKWQEEYLSIIAFALTFIAIVIAISLLGMALTKMVNLIALGLVNRILGGVFGFLKMAFLASILLMFLNQYPAINLGKETVEKSVLYPPVKKLAPMVLPAVLEKFEKENFFDQDVEEQATEDAV